MTRRGSVGVESQMLEFQRKKIRDLVFCMQRTRRLFQRPDILVGGAPM
jgi:hypothetical protein